MPTPKQLAANRRNAQNSTGPRTGEGKARSSRNALRSGIDARSQTIIHSETPADLEYLKNEYRDPFCPSIPEQRMLVGCAAAAIGRYNGDTEFTWHDFGQN